MLLFPANFALKVEVLFLAACFARSGEVLFFAPPKKSTQKKGDPKACPLRGFPALLAKPGARATRLRSNRRERPPVFTAMPGCARRVGSQNLTPIPASCTRLHSPSTAATPGTRRAPCLRQVYLPSCARPRRGEERRASAQPMSAAGLPFSLGTFSLALKRKYLARMGETGG